MIRIDFREEKKDIEIEGKTIKIYEELIILLAYLKGNLVHCGIESELAEEEIRKVVDVGLNSYELALEDFEKRDIRLRENMYKNPVKINNAVKSGTKSNIIRI